MPVLIELTESPSKVESRSALNRRASPLKEMYISNSFDLNYWE